MEGVLHLIDLNTKEVEQKDKGDKRRYPFVKVISYCFGGNHTYITGKVS